MVWIRQVRRWLFGLVWIGRYRTYIEERVHRRPRYQRRDLGTLDVACVHGGDAVIAASNTCSRDGKNGERKNSRRICSQVHRGSRKSVWVEGVLGSEGLSGR